MPHFSFSLVYFVSYWVLFSCLDGLCFIPHSILPFTYLDFSIGELN